MQPPPYGSIPPHGNFRPLEFGEIVEATTNIYRKNFGALITMAAVVVLPIRAVMLLVSLATQAIGTTLLFAIVLAFAGTIVVGACTRGVAEAYLRGTDIDTHASLRIAWDSFGSLVWISLLTSFGAGLGLVFCIAPGVWLWVSWIVATPVLLIEGTRGADALRRSFHLVRPQWWPTFGLVLVLGLAAGALSVMLNLFVIAATASSGSNGAARIIGLALTGTISSLLVTPFFAVAWVIVYFDLRVRSEGPPLPPPPFAPPPPGPAFPPPPTL